MLKLPTQNEHVTVEMYSKAELDIDKRKEVSDGIAFNPLKSIRSVTADSL